MPNLGTMSVGLGLDTGGLESGIGRAAGLLKNFGATSVVATAAAVVALGAASVKMAGDFQSSMESLVTGAGESQKNLKTVSDGVLNMAGPLGESTKQLADGLYMIESAGYHGAAGLKILQDAAEGAKVGNADLGVVADATTTILNDFGKQGVTSANAVNLLVQTVAAGKTHMEDLAGALSQILPTAAAAHVGLTDIMGAMATMTAEGIPAANAATYLRQTLLALDAPGSLAASTLQSVGLTTAQVADEMQKSLPGAIAMIVEAVGKKFPEGSAAYVAAIKDIAGGSKTMQGILDLSGDHLATFEQNVTNITGSVKAAGDSITGWSQVQGTWNQRIAEGKAIVETLAIKLGTVLLPVLGDIIDDVSKKVLPIFDEIGSMFTSTGKKVDTVVKPLLDLKNAFDEGEAATRRMFNTAQVAVKPLDEISRGINSVYTAVKVVVPPMDEGSRATQRFADQAKIVKPPLDNIVSLLNKDVVPNLRDLAIFTQKEVIPTVAQFAQWIMTKAVPAGIQLYGHLQRDLVPVFKTLWSVLQHDVIPQVESIGNTIFTRLVPSIEKLIDKLSPVLIPVFKLVGWVINNIVGPALNFIIGVVADFDSKLADVIGHIGDFLGKLGQIKDAVGNTLGNIGSGLHNAGIPGFAAGTPYAPGGLAVVGENGPEVIDLPRGSRVYPTGTAPSGMSGGDRHYHVHVTNQAPSMRQVMNGFRQMELLYG